MRTQVTMEYAEWTQLTCAGAPKETFRRLRRCQKVWKDDAWAVPAKASHSAGLKLWISIQAACGQTWVLKLVLRTGPSLAFQISLNLQSLQAVNLYPRVISTMYSGYTWDWSKRIYSRGPFLLGLARTHVQPAALAGESAPESQSFSV